MAEAMFNPDLRRKIKVRMRPDLQINLQRYNGQPFHIVKDPVSLRYYRFREEELFLLKQFDGKKTLDDIRHEFVEQYRPRRLSVPELEKFVGQLLQAGLATADTPQLGQRLYEKFRKQRNDKIKKTLSNVLYVKLPVFDPERILNRLLPWTNFLFTLPFFLVVLAFGLASALLVLVNWQTFVSKLPSYHEFFTWRNLLYFWLTLGVVKVMHEFGHGLSCKKFGGEVHEMGVLFLVLTPCLYCNVSDAWMLPNKWHRAVIGAAGMYVELFLSAVFVWVWWYTEPGLLNTLSLSIIFICSVTTVLFNGNPLLRFDGYYILSDLAEMPNLRERSTKFLGNSASKFFFGSEAVDDPFLPRRRRWFFVSYAIAAYVYRLFITVSILFFLYTFLKPYNLAVISQILAVAAAFPLLVLPVYKMVQTLKNRWRTMKVKKLRMVSTIAAAAAVLAAVLFAPFPMRVDAPLILQPRNATRIFVQRTGILRELDVEDTTSVMFGTRMARLHNPDLEKELRRLMVERELATRGKGALLALKDGGGAAKKDLEAQTISRLIDELRNEQKKLEMRADRTGVVFSPPKDKDMGTTLKNGELFCQIGDPLDLEAYIVVQHSDIELIKENQEKARPVWVKLAGHVGGILSGTVENISSNEIVELPQALSNKVGGEVQTSTDPEKKIERPLFKSYAVQVPVPNPDGTLRPGVRGTARFDIGYRSVYWRLKRYLQQTFHFRM